MASGVINRLIQGAIEKNFDGWTPRFSLATTDSLMFEFDGISTQLSIPRTFVHFIKLTSFNPSVLDCLLFKDNPLSNYMVIYQTRIKQKYHSHVSWFERLDDNTGFIAPFGVINDPNPCHPSVLFVDDVDFSIIVEGWWNRSTTTQGSLDGNLILNHTTDSNDQEFSKGWWNTIIS